jgi:NADH dehydrogenase
VSLAEYRTFGNIAGGLKIEGLIAKTMYRSLHKMHLLAVHGGAKTFFDTLADFISRRTEPRIKLH